MDATPSGWIPARNFAPLSHVPLWTDLSPRLGVAYDVRGDGRTALKVSLGKYVATSTGISVNPINTSVNSVTRTWTPTTAGDYIPHCDLGNFAANGECGPISNSGFGTLNIVTRYADDVIHGLNARGHNWDFSSEIQRQLSRSVSLSGGYYRSWYGNFTVTRNLAVNPSDYSPYCITAPKDPYLPKGGGYQICGLYDVDPDKFGKVDNLVQQASKFGHRSQVNNFFNVSLNARFSSGALFFGGFDTGRTVSDSCFIVNSPQDLLNCQIVKPFSSQTQIKLNGSYPLPAGFMVGAIFQNVSGPPADVIYAASTSEIFPLLKRNLAACGARSPCNATASIPLTVPGTMYEGRTTRLDLRLTKIVKIKERARVQVNMDLYNALNASSIISDYPGGAFNAGVNGATTISYGPTWRRPTDILEGRILQFSSQISF